MKNKFLPLLLACCLGLATPFVSWAQDDETPPVLLPPIETKPDNTIFSSQNEVTTQNDLGNGVTTTTEAETQTQVNTGGSFEITPIAGEDGLGGGIAGEFGVSAEAEARLAAAIGSEHAQLSAEAKAKVEALLGVKGEAQATITKEGIKIGIDASIGAVVSVDAEATIRGEFYGIAAEIKGSIGATAGALAEVKVEAEILFSGKVKIRAQAGVAVGIGVKGGFEVSVDASGLIERLGEKHGFDDVIGLAAWLQEASTNGQLVEELKNAGVIYFKEEMSEEARQALLEDSGVNAPPTYGTQTPELAQSPYLDRVSRKGSECARAADAAMLADDSYLNDNGQHTKSWVPVHTFDKGSGLQATVYRNADTGQVTIAFRGTDTALFGDAANVAADVINDVANDKDLHPVWSLQYDQAWAIAEQAKALYGDNIVLTGHSLGGGLAAYASAKTGLEAVTFNTATVAKSRLTDAERAAANVTNHIHRKDWLQARRDQGVDNNTLFGDTLIQDYVIDRGWKEKIGYSLAAVAVNRADEADISGENLHYHSMAQMRIGIANCARKYVEGIHVDDEGNLMNGPREIAPAVPLPDPEVADGNGGPGDGTGGPGDGTGGPGDTTGGPGDTTGGPGDTAGGPGTGDPTDPNAGNGDGEYGEGYRGSSICDHPRAEAYAKAAEYALASDYVYQDALNQPIPPGSLMDQHFEKLNFIEDTSTGLAVGIYRHRESGKVVVSFRGTQEGIDWLSNGLNGIGLAGPQHLQAITIVGDAINRYGRDNIVTTGHSLGGSLASGTAYGFGLESYTFNPAGVSLSELLGANIADWSRSTSDGITAYIHENDILENVANPVALGDVVLGEEVMLEDGPPDYATEGMVDAHSIAKMSQHLMQFINCDQDPPEIEIVDTDPGGGDGETGDGTGDNTGGENTGGENTGGDNTGDPNTPGSDPETTGDGNTNTDPADTNGTGGDTTGGDTTGGETGGDNPGGGNTDTNPGGPTPPGGGPKNPPMIPSLPPITPPNINPPSIPLPGSPLGNKGKKYDREKMLLERFGTKKRF